MQNPTREKPDYQYIVTDVPLRFQAIGERFLGRTLSNVRVMKW
jgi:glutamate racemase